MTINAREAPPAYCSHQMEHYRRINERTVICQACHTDLTARLTEEARRALPIRPIAQQHQAQPLRAAYIQPRRLPKVDATFLGIQLGPNGECIIL